MFFKKDKDFISVFNPETGFYLRSGIVIDGKFTDQDPFMASFPELLDIGIMGHCNHGRSGLCLKSGVECYQDGLRKNQENMSVENFTRILRESEGKVFQVALGGRGDPDEHENFEEILKTCRAFNIVPNFTTSGIGMNPYKANLCQKYCGAVAVSWYRSAYTINSINTLLKAGVKTNIYFVLNKNTIGEAIEHLKTDDFPAGINAVIFLLHKPVGLGREENTLTLDAKELYEFFDEALKKHPYKIGFDSCSVPFLIGLENKIDTDSVDTCEGARFSAYITPDMIMTPCSFDQKNTYGVSLYEHNMREAWESDKFENFRNTLKNSCPDCPKQKQCLGGCPIVPQIVLCEKA